MVMTMMTSPTTTQYHGATLLHGDEWQGGDAESNLSKYTHNN